MDYTLPEDLPLLEKAEEEGKYVKSSLAKSCPKYTSIAYMLLLQLQVCYNLCCAVLQLTVFDCINKIVA